MARISSAGLVLILLLGLVLGLALGAAARPAQTVTETKLVQQTLTQTLTTTETAYTIRTETKLFTITTTETTTSTLGAITVTHTVTEAQGGEVQQICFSKTMDCASVIVGLIDSATKYVYVAVYSFTSDRIADALIRAYQRGVEVRVVIEREQANVQGSEYERLKNAGVNVKLDDNSGLMHHKFVVIDGEMVITGSYNFSAAAEDRNDENVVVLVSDEIASRFESEFERVWSQAQA